MYLSLTCWTLITVGPIYVKSETSSQVASGHKRHSKFYFQISHKLLLITVEIVCMGLYVVNYVRHSNTQINKVQGSSKR